MEKDIEDLKYEDFIFKSQFERKVAIKHFLFTGRSIVIITTAVVILFSCGTTRVCQLVLIAMLAYLFATYYKTRLTYRANMELVPYDELGDEKTASILLISKLNWAKKRLLRKYYETTILD